MSEKSLGALELAAACRHFCLSSRPRNTGQEERVGTGMQVELSVPSGLDCGPPSASLPGDPLGFQQGWRVGAGQGQALSASLYSERGLLPHQTPRNSGWLRTCISQSMLGGQCGQRRDSWVDMQVTQTIARCASHFS